MIAAALSLADLQALKRFWSVRRSSLVLSLTATAGVVFFGVLQGIAIAVAMSVLLFFRSSWWPHGEVLGQVQGRPGWHHDPESDDPEPSDLLVFRWEAPLFFANSGMFRQQVRRHVRRVKPKWVLLQCEAITDIDVTAADMLRQLGIELNDADIELGFVELRSRLRALVSAYGLLDTLDRRHFYSTMTEAIAEVDASRLTRILRSASNGCAEAQHDDRQDRQRERAAARPSADTCRTARGRWPGRPSRRPTSA